MRRTHLDLIMGILSYAQEDIARTRLLQKMNMSYKQFNSYLNPLLEKEFLEEKVEECHKVYVTTEQGNFLLDDIKKILTILSD